MKRWLWIVAALGGIAAAVAFSLDRLVPSAPVTTFETRPDTRETAGLVSWRNPKADMAAFFPGSTRYVQKVLVLSDLRSQMVQRLGPRTVIDANSLYCFQVYRNDTRLGSVLAQRASGEYGAIEYIAAYNTRGQIVGVRLQRMREPQSTVQAIDNPKWLGALAGKDAHSHFKLGDDVPAVTPTATQTAAAVLESLRRLTVELNVARDHGRT